MKPLAQNTLIQNRYLIVQLIGKGGMGEVYLAVDQRLGSAVALKRTFFAGDEMLSNAFEREARILARMRHPVLPKVSDHFSEGDEQYLVMEHISGDDLASRLDAAKKPFPLSWVMFWADQLLDSLSYLHSHEPPIIHRDIKPQNLKLTDENHVILLDFGLSKNSTGQSKVDDSGSTGSVVGYTPHYAPMEQIRGIGTSPKSDIYSLAATLYQLLTNVVPPDALSRADEMLNGLPDPIQPPNKVNSEIPAAVGEVIIRAMEVSQDKRYENARDMQKALRKAHAQMQNEMSAHTVVMNSEGTSQSDSVPLNAPSIDKTEVMNFAAAGVLSVPTAVTAVNSEASSNMVGDSQSPAFDPNATIAFDPNGEPSVPLQADVKTEVFIAGSNSFPVPRSNDPVVESAPSYSEPAEVENFADTSFGDSNGAVEDGDYTPDATMPIIAFNEFADSAGIDETNDYSDQSVPEGFESAAALSGVADFAPKASDSYVPLPPKVKKSSGGKVFAIIGGLLALFVIGAAAVGGGWYYYNNYYAVASEPEPSPTPYEEPSPEPTIDFAATNSDDSNSDVSSTTDSNTNSNTNTNTGALIVGPTPEPASTQSETVATRSTTPVVTKNNTQKTTTTPIKKPTPAPKSTRNRNIILQ